MRPVAAESLAGVRVLVTRDREASERFAARLSRLGASPVICPAIATRYRNPPGFDEALSALDRFDWLVLTSAKAVRAIEMRLAAMKLDPADALEQVRCATVGRTTERALVEMGGRAEIVADPANADNLAERLVAAGIEGALILFPASRIARPVLGQRLRSAGAGVVQLGVYETVAPDGLQVPDASEIDVAIFTSPSALRHIANRAPPGWFSRTPVICIGATTADAARDAGANAPIVAAEASVDGILEALLQFNWQREQE